MAAVEAGLAPAVAVWNYNAHHSEALGDGWNREDFSVWTPGPAPGGAGGGLRMPGVVRPYPRRLAGRPLVMRFDSLAKGRPFVLEFEEEEEEDAEEDEAEAGREEGHGAARRGAGAGETEVFVPALHYPGGPTVRVSDGTFRLDPALQLLTYAHVPGAGAGRHRVELWAAGAAAP